MNAKRWLTHLLIVLGLARKLWRLGADGVRLLYFRFLVLRRLLLKSLFAKITATVIAGIVVTSTVVGWYASRTTEGILSTKVNQDLPFYLRQVKEQVYTWYDTMNRAMSTFANSEVLLRDMTRIAQEDLTAEERTNALEDLRKYLSLINERDLNVLDLVLIDAQGRTLVSTNSYPQMDESAKNFLTMSSSLYTSPILLQEDGLPQQYIAQAVGNPNRRIGTLVAFLNLHNVKTLLENSRVSKAGSVYLVAADGRIFLGAGDVEIAGFVDEEKVDRDEEELPSVYKRSDGKKVFGASLYFPQFGWTLVCEEDYGDVFEPILLIRKKLILVNSVIILLFSLFAFKVVQSITRPVLALSNAASKLMDGMVAVEVREHDSEDEVGFLIKTFNELTKEIAVSRVKLESINRKLELKNNELEQLNSRLEHLSVTDELTGLYNYRHFQTLLNEEIKRVERNAYPLSLVLMDLDSFKKVNDRYGHKTGDDYLCYLSKILRGLVRETDVLARYGGEEFAILLPHTDIKGSKRFAEKLCRMVESSHFTTESGEKLHGTVSIGVSEYRGDPLRFFEDADKGLYESKRNGKNQVTIAVA